MKLPYAEILDVAKFEKGRAGAHRHAEEIVMRHRSPHFSHVFSGGGYASAYYSDMWSEVMDADAFDAFTETGDAFDPATAKKLHDNVYAAGNRRDPGEAAGFPAAAADRRRTVEEAGTYRSLGVATTAALEI